MTTIIATTPSALTIEYVLPVLASFCSGVLAGALMATAILTARRVRKGGWLRPVNGGKA